MKGQEPIRSPSLLFPCPSHLSTAAYPSATSYIATQHAPLPTLGLTMHAVPLAASTSTVAQRARPRRRTCPDPAISLPDLRFRPRLGLPALYVFSFWMTIVCPWMDVVRCSADWVQGRCYARGCVLHATGGDMTSFTVHDGQGDC